MPHVDIQDVGARYYTYAATLALAMKVCGPLGISDRSRPTQSIGGHLVEGCGVEPGYENFVASFATTSCNCRQLAHLYVKAFGVDCEWGYQV